MKKTLLFTGAAIGLGLFCSPANASVSSGKESKVRKALSAANRKTAAMNAELTIITPRSENSRPNMMVTAIIAR